MGILGSELGGDRGKKPLRGFNAYLRDFLNYTQEGRADQLGRDVRTIQRWDKEDRERRCATHVFTRETARETLKEYRWSMVQDRSTGASRTDKVTAIERCRYCVHERQRPTFFHIN